MIDDMAVYIANLGKYNEGYLVGAWFTFPIDEEDVKEKIGLNEHVPPEKMELPSAGCSLCGDFCRGKQRQRVQ